MAWRTRRSQIDDSLTTLRDALKNDLRGSEAARTKLESPEHNDAGTLLDLIQLLPDNCKRTIFEHVASKQLSLHADFQAFHTLSQQAQIGCSVSVVEGCNLGTSGRVYAAKTMTKLSALKLEGQTSVWHERNILVEAARLKTPYIVHLIAAMQDEAELTLVLEYLPACDLGLLLEERKTMPEGWARHWTAECLQAILWLHDLGYAHRDIKPANLLLTESGHAKLTDFASAAPTSSVGALKMVQRRYCLSPVGTVDYIAPDILLAHEAVIEESRDDEASPTDGPGLYDASVDLWSVGVMLYEMLSGSLPFYAPSVPETYEKIVNHANSLHFKGVRWSQDSRGFIEGCLCSSEDRLGRRSQDQIQRHPFLANMDWSSLHKQPGPFKPSIRPLTETGNQSASEMLSKGFDFSALFSSPGLSILRENKQDGQAAKEKWIGFTYLPPADAFDARPGDITRAQLRKGASVTATAMAAFPCTPARSSVSPYAIGSSTKRRQNVEGLKEIVTYGILKTAKKASAATVKRQQRDEPSKRELNDLEARQRRLLNNIDAIDKRYQELLNKATAMSTTT